MGKKQTGVYLIIAFLLVSLLVMPQVLSVVSHPIELSVVRYGYKIRFDYFPDEVNENYWQKGWRITTFIHPEEILYRTDRGFTWTNICYVSAIRVEFELTPLGIEEYSNNTILIHGYIVFAKNSFNKILFAQHGTIAFFTNTSHYPIPDSGNHMSRFLFTWRPFPRRLLGQFLHPYNRANAIFNPFIRLVWQMNGLDMEDKDNKTHIEGEYYNTITQEIVKLWIDISYNESGYHNETCGVRFL